MITIPSHPPLIRGLLAGAEAAHHFASVLRSQYEAFWSRDTATVLAELNANISQNVAIFELNTQAGTAVNSLSDNAAHWHSNGHIYRSHRRSNRSDGSSCGIEYHAPSRKLS